MCGELFDLTRALLRTAEINAMAKKARQPLFAPLKASPNVYPTSPPTDSVSPGRGEEKGEKKKRAYGKL